MNDLRLGVVGIGNMGSTHACSIYSGKVEGARLVAVCDIDESKKKWAEDNLQGVAFFEDYEEMFDSKLIDAVIIATPHYLHPVVAISAFEKGLHVLSEKPAGVYTKQVEEMYEIAEKSGKVFSIMYNQRNNPLFRKAREIVQNGEIGEVIRAVWVVTNWYRFQQYYESSIWRATWKGEGGGLLVNQCVHNIDIMQWIVGMPKKVVGHCCYGRFHNIEVEDDISAYFEYENGATGVFISSTGEFPGVNRLEISGTKGKIVLENGKINICRSSVSEREYCFYSKEEFADKVRFKSEEITLPDLPAGQAHIMILQNFVNAVLYGEELIAPGFDGIKGLSISNAVHLSDWTGKPVELPVDGDLFKELLDKKIALSAERERKVKDSSIDIGKASSRWEVKW